MYNNTALICAIKKGINTCTFSIIWNLSRNKTSPFLGFDKIAVLLIQGGADVNVVGQYGYTALNYAVDMGKKNFSLKTYDLSLPFSFNHRIWENCSNAHRNGCKCKCCEWRSYFGTLTCN